MAITLKSIAAGASLKPPKIAIYGVGGVGKTTFASQAPKPIFLCTEEGLGSLDVARFEPRTNDALIRSWAELIECLDVLLKESHNFKTVVIDSLDFAEPLLWDHVCKVDKKPDIEAYGYGKGYIRATNEARQMILRLERLRAQKQMATVLVAHSHVRRHERPDSEGYDRYQLRLHQKLADYIHDWVDALFFANWKVRIVRRTRDSTKGERAASAKASA